MKEQAPRDAGSALREILAVPSYLSAGYRVRSRLWDPADLDVDMTGKVCVVTGANRGLGFGAARALCRMGATVVLVCRDRERGAEACRALSAAGGADRVVLEICDVAVVGAVRAFAGRFSRRFSRLDVLINNAGALFAERRRSAEGHEMTFATNVLGGFHLTRLLLPHLIAAAPSRIVHVGSAAQYVARLDARALVDAPWPYVGELAYAHSKRAIAELGALWADRLAGTSVTSNVVHPGLAATPGVERTFPRYRRWFGRVLRDVDQGADTMVWLAVSRAARAETGKVWFDRAPHPSHVVPQTRSHPAEAERLWEECSLCCGLPAAIGRFS